MGHDTQDENSYAGQIVQRVPQAEPQTQGIHERLDQIQARIELAYRMSADVNLALRGRSDEHREMLKSALDRLERMEQASARSEERIRDEAFKRGVLIGREEAEVDADGGPLALLTAGVQIPDGASTERERNAERRHREIIATALARSAATNVLEAITTDIGPSDYEVWRDALLIAATCHSDWTHGTDQHTVVVACAEKLVSSLKNVRLVQASPDGEEKAEEATPEPFRPDLGDVNPGPASWADGDPEDDD